MRSPVGRAGYLHGRQPARMLFLLPVLLMPCGCDDPALERGTPPPILLHQARFDVPLRRYPAGRVLQQDLAALAWDGNTRAIDAVIRSTSARQRDATRAALIRMGLDPARISWAARPDQTVMLTRTTATTTPCGTALHSDWQGDVGNSLTSLGTCIQANNLAQMVSDSRDLARPVTLAPTSGAVAAQAVNDWENPGARAQARRTADGTGTRAGADPGMQSDTTSPPPAGDASGATALNPLLAPSLAPGP